MQTLYWQNILEIFKSKLIRHFMRVCVRVCTRVCASMCSCWFSVNSHVCKCLKNFIAYAKVLYKCANVCMYVRVWMCMCVWMCICGNLREQINKDRKHYYECAYIICLLFAFVRLYVWTEVEKKWALLFARFSAIYSYVCVRVCMCVWVGKYYQALANENVLP